MVILGSGELPVGEHLPGQDVESLAEIVPLLVVGRTGPLMGCRALLILVGVLGY